MSGDADEVQIDNQHLIREIIGLERTYFFEKRNVKSEKQKKLREIIERHTAAGGDENDN